MLEKIAHYLDICRIHWKEIFALSFIMHFLFDGFILLLGIIIGINL